jgi:hypothetical protein
MKIFSRCRDRVRDDLRHFSLCRAGVIPLMQSQGTDEEEAAHVLGASGWQMFWRVTLPNIKWGLLYGIDALCNARAVGEFGAVSVVSGHIRGRTNTFPLHVESLYDDYNFAAAFAVASLLALLALVTLAAKTWVEWRFRSETAARHSAVNQRQMALFFKPMALIVEDTRHSLQESRQWLTAQSPIQGTGQYRKNGERDFGCCFHDTVARQLDQDPLDAHFFRRESVV